MATYDQYDAFDERQTKHPTSDFDTFVHLVKGSFGVGFFAMPYAFKHLGLWAGIAGTVFLGLICTYCINMLVQASQTLCYRCRVPHLNYAETAEKAFLNDQWHMNKSAILMRFIVNFFLVINLLACVSIYFVNVARHIQQLTDLYLLNNGIDIRCWILIVAVPMTMLCLIRELKYLVPFSLIANIFTVLDLLITFSYIFKDLSDPMDRPIANSIELWPVFFGTSMFALECVSVVLPCEKEMKSPQNLIGCPSVLGAAMIVVVLLHGFLGFFGYFKYGDAVEANIILNIPVKDKWAQFTKFFVALAIYFSILLQIYVPIQIISDGLKHCVPVSFHNVTKYGIPVILVTLCAGVAAALPNLGPFISLIGSVSLSILGLILPAILDLVVFRIYFGYGRLKIHLIKNVFIITLGVFGFLTGSVQSIRYLILNKLH